VAWIRRVRTASGATAVQITEYVHGRREIVAHVGSAHTDVELGLLMAKARVLLADDAQDELDLGVEAVPVKSDLLDPVMAEDALFTAADDAPTALGRPVTMPQVVATSSRLLYEAIGGIYDDLGFDVLGDAAFRDLVIARIVEPTSILDVGRVLADLGKVAASEKTMRRTLARCVDGDYRDQIATACFARALATGDVSLVLYDVTTLYFEAEKEDTLRKVGFSNYAAVLVMPRSSCAGWCSCWSAASLGAAGAA